ncbi:CPBP family intramembrane glutamic endopeptidase [Scopulibacillus cellulosilyticus]|uniref:CPBP family intramembrane glutamic endopeptidase n=1 Tax=Scopulibacillus cellulosilyticus TaxID=2665665 RepID=A0ABW2PPN4_9BACL
MTTVFKNKNGQIRSGYLISFTGLLALAFSMVLSIPATIIMVISQYNPSSRTLEIEKITNDMSSYYLLNITQEIGIIIAVIIAWKLFNKAKVKNIGFGFYKGVRQILLGLLLGFLSMTLIFIFLRILGAVDVANSIIHPHISKYLLLDILLYVLVGIAEELFFRGYIIGTMLQRGNNKLWCMTVSAIIFGCTHLINPNVAAVGIINIALVGVLFTYMYISTGKLWLSIGFHITWNYFQGSVFGFHVSGTETHGLYITKINSHQWLLNGGHFGPEAGLLTTIVVIINLFVLFWWNRKKTLNHSFEVQKELAE